MEGPYFCTVEKVTISLTNKQICDTIEQLVAILVTIN